MLCCKHSGIISPAKRFRICVILRTVSKYGDGGKLCEAKMEKNKSGCIASRMQNNPLNRSSLRREPSETVYWWSCAQKHKLQYPHTCTTPADIACIVLWVTIFYLETPVSICAKQWIAIRSYVDNPQTDHFAAVSLNLDQQISFKHFQQQELINPLHLNFPPETITTHDSSTAATTLIHLTAAWSPEVAPSSRSYRFHLDLLCYTFI